MSQFFYPGLNVLLFNQVTEFNAFTSVILPLITAAIGGVFGYYTARRLVKLERNADFQKRLDEEQIIAHKKLYAAARHVSIRKENPFSLAFKQSDDRIFIRRSNAQQFVQDISMFLLSENGAFIDTKLSQPLWGLRNLIYGILEIEKESTSEEIELIKKGDDLVEYIETFRNNFMQLFQLRNRNVINILPD